MTTAVTVAKDGGAMLEQVLVGGDLSKLKPEERVMYYKQVCESVGLNPLTKPFEYITLNGKLTLYAKRDCTDQLRKLNAVSIIIKSRETVEGCYIVTAQATDKSGRHDESIGAVPINNVQGEARSNAIMKAETKAKRRVTLSICGMGWLDESEVDSIPNAYPSPALAGPITPTSGALASQPAARQEVIIATAEQIKEAFAEDRLDDAYSLYSASGFDAEEKIALWSLLDSKIRSALKRMNEAERSTTAGTISPAQKKRLEALIKEHGLSRDAVKSFVAANFNKEHFGDLTPAEYADLENNLQALKEAA